MGVRKRSIRTDSQQKTRNLLIAAAAKLVVEHGYAGASLRDIVKAAGFTQGAFYPNFESKEALMIEVMKGYFGRSQSELRALLDESREEPIRMMRRLETWLVAFFEDATATLQIEMDLHAKRSPAFAKRYKILVDQHKDALTEILERIADAKNAKLEVPARDVASGLFALTRGLLLEAKKKDQRPPGSIVSFFLEAFLKS